MHTRVAGSLASLALALAACGGAGGGADAAPTGVTVAPPSASLSPGAAVQFQAAVAGAAAAVSWSVSEASAAGAISASGLFTAPATLGTYHVVATSVADPTKSATAVVTVRAASACLGSDLVAALGKGNRVLVGFSGADAVASQASWDLRYQYLAGGIATSCTAGTDWWGCWQDISQPPGQFATGFLDGATSRGELGMLTYYIILPASGAGEGRGEVAAASDAGFMGRYFGDFRFLAQKIGARKALLHLEPDFWGYAQQVNSDPHAIPAAVASANPTDCAGYENSIAGLGQCLVAMVRKYAPSAKVGLHASAWASGPDVYLNTSAGLDVAAEAREVAAFLSECGAGLGDYVVVEMSDRDAGYYQSLGQNRWWNTDDRLPSFHQALAWAKALAEAVGKPLLYWQVPVGNMDQANATDHWKDNRVQYFFDHPAEFADAHAVGIAFGAGATGQTTPSTDGGYLGGRAASYLSAGGTAACP